MLLLWARALVFARQNNFKLIITPWWGFRWGALLRKERKKRIYWKYFKETGILQLFQFNILKVFKVIIQEPKIEIIDKNSIPINSVFEFNKVMTDYDLFGALRPHQQLINKELMDLLHPSKKLQFLNQKVPVIGVHIRRGDFKLGSTLTELDFFIKAIVLVRKELGEDTPVTIFTDADEHEIKEVLQLPHIKIAEKNADIVDILLLSKSKVLILSAGSTFSYWAAFLSNAFVIKSSIDWLKLIKYDNVETGYREIEWNIMDDNSSEVLEEKIKEYFRHIEKSDE